MESTLKACYKLGDNRARMFATSADKWIRIYSHGHLGAIEALPRRNDAYNRALMALDQVKWQQNILLDFWRPCVDGDIDMTPVWSMPAVAGKNAWLIKLEAVIWADADS